MRRYLGIRSLGRLRDGDNIKQGLGCVFGDDGIVSRGWLAMLKCLVVLPECNSLVSSFAFLLQTWLQSLAVH